MRFPAVLSIQSHVVHGYVGNKCSTFPLQLLGFEVDAVNSVQYSNHVHYKVFKGQEMNGLDLEKIFQGLHENGITKSYTHILTGYCKSSAFLSSVVKTVESMKKMHPSVKYVCDPVMGDNKKFYVSEDQVQIYRNSLVPMADIITPNQFEAEVLTGIEIKSEPDVVKVMDYFHAKGISCVILTSSDLGGKEFLPAFASKVRGSEIDRIRIAIPRIAANFVGPGDLFTALILAWLHKSDWDLRTSLEKTVCTMQSVLTRTYQNAISSGVLDDASLELKIIQSKLDIENPSNRFKCTNFVTS